MALPVNVRDLMNIGNQLATEREKALGLLVVVEVDAPDALIVALEDALRPRTARVRVIVEVAGAAPIRLSPETDAVITLLGSGGLDVQGVIADAREHTVPCAALALRGVSTAKAAAVHVPLDDFLADELAVPLVREQLAAWLADRLASKRLALAANFDFLRPAVSNEYVKATAWQNALIGGIAIIPGADMPLMTGNQAKMVLQIAAAYGQKLDGERGRELLAVVGGGFAFRAVARQLLDFIPGFGWALKAGIGYTGTIAMGKAAIAYFEEGADLGTITARLQAGALDVTARVLPEPRKRGLPWRRKRREIEPPAVPAAQPPLQTQLPSPEPPAGGLTQPPAGPGTTPEGAGA